MNRTLFHRVIFRPPCGLALFKSLISPWLARLVFFSCFSILGQQGQVFDLNVGEMINGFESVQGEGFMESTGEIETYRIEAQAGEQIFLEWSNYDRSLIALPVKLVAPTGDAVLTTLLSSPDARGLVRLNRSGTYQMVVGPSSSQMVGRFVFRLHAVPAAQSYQMKGDALILPDDAWKGGGHIESPGSVDAILFSSGASEKFIVDFTDWDKGLTRVDWAIQIKKAENFYALYAGLQGNIGDSPSRRLITLQPDDDYRLKIGDLLDPGTGSYSLAFTRVPPPQNFSIDIDEEILISSIAEGAGFIETEAATDVYQWYQSQPGRLFIDLVDFDPELLSCRMSLHGPRDAGTALLNQSFFSGDPGALYLEEPGTYTLKIGGNLGSGLGGYTLRILPVPDDERFSLTLGEIARVHPGNPGMGMIEVSGARDIYSFEGEAGKNVFVERLSAVEELGSLFWTLKSPSGKTLFSQCMGCSNPSPTRLSETGTYELIVGGFEYLGTGAYSFQITEVPEPDIYLLRGNSMTVSLNQPDVGAGVLEVPGEIDVYRIPMQRGESCHLKLDSGSLDLDWKLTFGGEVVFDSEVVDGFSPQPFDQFFAAEQSGDYYLQVSRSSANRVHYSFTFETLPACVEPNPESDSKLPSIGVLNWKDGDSVDAMHVDLKGTVGWDAGVMAMDLVLVMDSSDSLAVSDPEGKRLDAIRSFIDSLPVDAPLRLGLVDFDSQARLLQPLTASWEEILNRLDELDARGGTDIEAAMNVALDEIANHGNEDSIPSVILFSDGEISQGNPVTTTMRSQEMGVTVHTVFLGEPDLQGARWLQTISTATCGNHRSATSASQLGNIFKNLTNRVPVDQIAVTSSALPGMGFIGTLSGSFWEVGEVPVTQDEMEPTELRIVVTTAENPPRSVSSTLRLQYGSVPNQAPVMETVPNIESNEDEPVQIVLAVHDNDDPAFEPSIDLSFSQPEWVDTDQGVHSEYQDGQLTLSWLPAKDRNGRSKITLSVADERGARTEQTIVWTLLPVNDPPFLSGPQQILIEPGKPLLPIAITEITDGSEFETQDLEFSIQTQGDPIIATHKMVFQQGESSGYLNLTLHSGVYGQAELSLIVDDGETHHSVYTHRFLITVKAPDNLVPSVEWIKPASELRISSNTAIELMVLATDVDGSIASLIFQANGEPIGEADPSVGLLPWTPPGVGTYLLTATVVDNLGARTTSPSLRVLVDPPMNEVPTIQWIHPEDDTRLWLGQSLQLQVLADDSDGQIASIRFAVDGEFLKANAPKDPKLNWTPDALGRYALSAMVEDDSGASSTTPSRWVTVVARPPEFGMEILEPKDRAVVCRGQSTRVELSLEGDPPEGVVVHLYAGDRLVALRSAAPYVFDWVPDSVGDFLLRAVAFREDGTEVSSSPVRIGVSSTCFQVGLLPTAVPVVEKELIQDLLFEMGVGMHWLPSELEDPAALDGMDMILAMEDAEVGVPHEMLGWLEYLYFDRQLPVYLLGNHLLSATSGLTSEEYQRWEHLVHLQGQGVEGVHQQVVLEERGFFQSFLQGRFGQVSPFLVSGEMDQASATSNAEAIVKLDETDLMVRYPAGGMAEAAQPRWVSQNFPLSGPVGQGKDPIRRALFQNAVCWLLQCGTCSLNDLQLTLKDWDGESTTGEWVEQSFELANVGACEATDTRVFIKYPKGVELGSAEFSQGLGAENHQEGGVLQIHVGRLTNGAASKMTGSFRTQALIPGLHEIQVCVESNHTESNCETYYWMSSGDPLMPATIAMHWSEDRMLWLRVEGLEGMSYRIQMSHDLETWVDFADAPGPLTELPIPQDLSEGGAATFFRLVSGMQ